MFPGCLFKQSWLDRSKELARAVANAKGAKRVVLFGPNEPPRAQKLKEKIRDRLRSAGYRNACLVDDIPDEASPGALNAHDRSMYWVENADYCIFILYPPSGSQGVAIELHHALEKGDEILRRSFCLVGRERAADDPDRVLSEVLSDHHNWRKIRIGRVVISDFNQVFAAVKSYLDSQILGLTE